MEISGFTCAWPLWNGKRTVSKKWPAGRIFIFQRQRVRFFGIIEQVPIADGKYQPVDLVLHHQPNRKSFGLGNLIFRRQAYRWRAIIARSLLGKPTDLPCWRWEDETWPGHWRQLREHPWRTALAGLTIGSLRALRDQWRTERRFFPGRMPEPCTFSSVSNARNARSNRVWGSTAILVILSSNCLRISRARLTAGSIFS